LAETNGAGLTAFGVRGSDARENGRGRQQCPVVTLIGTPSCRHSGAFKLLLSMVSRGRNRLNLVEPHPVEKPTLPSRVAVVSHKSA
jgi:hypothetical protein